MGRKKKAASDSLGVRIAPMDGSRKCDDNGRPARKHSGGSRFAEKPVQRNAANARERARMRTLSKAFSRLKTTLPWVPADTKLSKLDTLRSALTYIQHLCRVLNDDPDQSEEAIIQPVRQTWPLMTTHTPSAMSARHLPRTGDNPIFSA
ncbi:putative Transcription factor 21 [Hypsibius exemplaris]|uniref:Transcription factor 21 n=1 Tax=Hypsibius exemplaris TaxID=2072580 RepID=A0A9X6NAZ2_HYPEX|nr:putative Transcription factor 21 [Hypsibius exemplaris]